MALSSSLMVGNTSCIALHCIVLADPGALSLSVAEVPLSLPARADHCKLGAMEGPK
jgi:hypothetical protein